MLVLTRKQQEKIQIGDEITITILRTKGKTVRVGIEAPSTVPVLRGELAARIREEEQEAVASDSEDQPATQEDSDCTQVVHQRTPRSRVSTVLPQLLGDRVLEEVGPLRAMLDRRQSASPSI